MKIDLSTKGDLARELSVGPQNIPLNMMVNGKRVAEVDLAFTEEGAVLTVGKAKRAAKKPAKKAAKK